MTDGTDGTDGTDDDDVVISLRRSRGRRGRTPAFTDPAHTAKQESRERIARAFAKYFGDMDAPKFFLLPGNEVLCAKTINGHIPHAIFYGAEYSKYVFENIDAVTPHKRVIMQRKSVARYINDNAGSLQFDAAFLDYKAFYTPEKRAEIQEFAAKMLKTTAVLAVTVQRKGSGIAQIIQQDLMRGATSVILEDSLEYTTDRPMINAIFLLTL